PPMRHPAGRGELPALICKHRHDASCCWCRYVCSVHRHEIFADSNCWVVHLIASEYYHFPEFGARVTNKNQYGIVKFARWCYRNRQSLLPCRNRIRDRRLTRSTRGNARQPPIAWLDTSRDSCAERDGVRTAVKFSFSQPTIVG